MPIDPADAWSAAVAERATFSQLHLEWTEPGGARARATRISGAPQFDRERNFAGFLGFGVLTCETREMARPPEPEPEPEASPSEPQTHSTAAVLSEPEREAPALATTPEGDLTREPGPEDARPEEAPPDAAASSEPVADASASPSEEAGAGSPRAGAEIVMLRPGAGASNSAPNVVPIRPGALNVLAPPPKSRNPSRNGDEVVS